jgi:molybdopterin converting factor small subunit
MISLYPELEKAVFTGKDKLHPLVEIYLNSASAYPDALKKEVKDGDKLHLIHTLAGG